MRRRRQAMISDLRLAVECLPRSTRMAMLEGITTNEIIVGAYTDGGGICPMLAAHRAGGRTNLISFAHAWDRFAFRGSRVRIARRASDRELLVLRTHLEASLLEEDSPTAEMVVAITEHQNLLQRDADSTRAEVPGRRADAPERSKELERRERSSWVRVFRRRDVYEGALARLRSEQETNGERELTRTG